jgi:hypothetical protein
MMKTVGFSKLAAAPQLSPTKKSIWIALWVVNPGRIGNPLCLEADFAS